jgi:hypothetical protein
MDLQFRDYATKNPLFFADYAEATSQDVAGERVFVNGGIGNPRLLAFDHTKTSDLKLTLPLVDLNLLALLSGDTISTGIQNIYKREVLTVSAGSTATLSQTPLAGTTPSVFYLQGTRDNGTALTKVASAPTAGQYSISSATVTVNSADNGKQIVVWYQYATASSATNITVKASSFASAVQIVGTGLARDQVTETDVATNITFYKARPQNNFTITMSSTAVTTLELTFDLFAEKVGTDYVYADYVFLT